MNEVLTVEEIQNQFRDEWVLIDEPELDVNFEVIRGRVASHSHARDDVYRKAVELKLKNSAFLFMGAIPADKVFIL